jgi:hypothetical protein
LNPCTVIPCLIDRCEIDLPICEEIEFVASDIYEFSFSSLFKVYLNAIAVILSRASLRIESEDFFMNWLFYE